MQYDVLQYGIMSLELPALQYGDTGNEAKRSSSGEARWIKLDGLAKGRPQQHLPLMIKSRLSKQEKVTAAKCATQKAHSPRASPITRRRYKVKDPNGEQSHESTYLGHKHFRKIIKFLHSLVITSELLVRNSAIQTLTKMHFTATLILVAASVLAVPIAQLDGVTGFSPNELPSPPQVEELDPNCFPVPPKIKTRRNGVTDFSPNQLPSPPQVEEFTPDSFPAPPRTKTRRSGVKGFSPNELRSPAQVEDIAPNGFPAPAVE